MEEPRGTRTEIETPLARRVKVVTARELRDAQIVVNDGRPAPIQPGATALEPLRDPTSAPAIDPTAALGSRRRKRSHHTRYRLSQICLLLSLAASALAIGFVAIEDRWLARAAATAGVLLGLLAVGVVWSSRSELTSRMAGYGAVATILASLTAGLIFLGPAHWFAEKSPEQIQQELLSPIPARNRPASR